MKVWLKTKFDAGMNMEIPHSYNMANAMYGFRELGAEIVPYHSIDEIYDWVTKDDIVLDYIDQCNAIFNKFNVTPNIPDYPKEFEKFLGRKIWEDTIDSISTMEEKWSAGWFVKPKKDKAFTGKIIKNIADLVGCGNHSENYEVLCSEPLDILAEWRCFILYDNIIDVRPYGLLLNSRNPGKTPDWNFHYDEKVLNEMLETFRNWEDRPMGCSMDICVTKDNRTLLVEFNDAYALGCYGLPSLYYAKLISARWSQLLNRPDEFNFKF